MKPAEPLSAREPKRRRRDGEPASPGGRPRRSPAPKSKFGRWLKGQGLSAEQVASELGVSVSSVYNIRNGYFVPGRDLAVAIDKLSRGAVPVTSWSRPERRGRSLSDSRDEIAARIAARKKGTP